MNVVIRFDLPIFGSPRKTTLRIREGGAVANDMIRNSVRSVVAAAVVAIVVGVW